MGELSRRWINKNRKKLEKMYDGKTVIVNKNKVIKVFEGAANPLKINDIAREICRNNDWSYTYLGGEDEYLL